MIPPALPFLLLFALLSPPSLSDDYLDCSLHHYQCGSDIYDIRYPFRLRDSPTYCGDPQFGDLYCSTYSTTLLATISGTEYQVNQIDYTHHILHITDMSVLYSTDPSCPRAPTTNISLNSALFSYSVLDANLTIYRNCKPGHPVPTPLHKITCPGDDNGHMSFFYRLPGEPPPSADVWDVCDSMVIVPVNRTVAASDFAAAVRGGFALTWKENDEACDKCVKSNGICGNNPASGAAPVCLCSNATSINGVCVPNKESKTSRKSNIIIGIVAGIGGALILGCCIFFLYNRRKKQRQASLSNLLSRSTSSKISSSKKDPELGDTNYHTHIFSYEELEEATNGFNESRELGDGGFGTVYKGKLRDGRTVAVKRLYENNYRRLEQFKNEVEILSSLRHQNLVTLYGCTSRHSRELLLVYEYIPNGTLADHLHGHLASNGALPWPVRMSIAIETADALAYLHAVEPQVIHRDVKSNNILLDGNFHVKVADFGLSRLFPLDATHVSTAPQGTPGYVDPEYHQCYQLTDKSDVYSFGVVLVELISSKPAVDISRHRHEINLSNMAITKIQNCQIDQLVDPELGYQSHPEIKGMINQVAELAFRCLQPDREMRPCIKEVLEVLKGLEGRGHKAEKEAEVAEVQVKEESRLLKNVSPFSPDSVTERWSSRSTTPNTST